MAVQSPAHRSGHRVVRGALPVPRIPVESGVFRKRRRREVAGPGHSGGRTQRMGSSDAPVGLRATVGEERRENLGNRSAGFVRVTI
jgi:hypothetical protein